MSVNTLGIYFGPKTITAVETKGRNPINHIRILQSTIVSSELEERVPLEVKGVGLVALFKSEFQKYKIEANEAALGLSGKDLIVRIFELPVLPRAELQSAVNFEVKKYIPFKTEELVSGFQIKYNKSDKVNLVLFMGVKRETLERYSAMLAQLGVRIKDIEYSPFSLLRTLSFARIADHEVIGVLMSDITGEDEVNFTVLEDGFPLFTRDISLTSTREEMFDGLSDVSPLDKLRTEFHVSLDYFLRRFPEKSIKKVYLITNKEHLQSLETFMGEIGVSAHYIDIERQVRQSAVYSLTYLKAYYVSLYRSAKTSITINLLQEMERRITTKESIGQGPMSLFEDLNVDYRIVAMGLILCLATFLYGLRQNKVFLKSINKLIGERPPVQRIDPNTDNEELNRLIEEYTKRMQGIDRMIRQRVLLTDIINMLPRVLPEGASLRSFSFRITGDFMAEFLLDGMVFLDNSAKEFEIVNKLDENLRLDPEFRKYFNDIVINKIEQQRLPDADNMATYFSLTCRRK
ncbi:MAG: pilus assembly protein PilM [Candidatus Omnitrophica bacterium]|nr:pilus assembly protein PilM [Candidatus Omnitrophota bacterium]